MALTDMYPGKSNSPKTSLKNDITATATTITVVDSSVLPEAPNLMVIGSNERSEVVIYGGKNGNDLTQCIRGAGGTQKSIWTAGVNVSRNFTNLDYEILCNNVRDLDSRKRNVEDKINVGTEVTSILNVENGGTGQNSLSGVRNWIGLKELAYKTIIALATDVSGILGVENGGTGVSSLNALRNALGLGNDATKVLQLQNGGTGVSTINALRNALGLGNDATKVLQPQNGGTGESSLQSARNAMGLGNTTGALPLANGGTGVGLTKNPSMLVNLASGNAANTFANDPRPGVTGVLKIANGGTEASTAAEARTKLGITAIATRQNYEISTTDLVAGSSALATGKLYFYIE